MSRDLTPRELYNLEQYQIKNGRGSLLEFMRNTSFTYDGKTSPLYSEEEITLRQQYPYLGRLFNRFGNLHSLLSQVNGGLEILARYEKELSDYIRTGEGDKHSALIKWFEGTLDEYFYYCERNDDMLLNFVQEDVAKTYRANLSMNKCFWFPLDHDKCISVCRIPDATGSDQFLMKLEQRAEDGSMGPHCKVISEESYTTSKISLDHISRSLSEICEDAGLTPVSKSTVQAVAENIMVSFGLRKPSLGSQIISAAKHSSEPDISPERKQKQNTPGL